MLVDSDLHILGAVLYTNTYNRRKPLFWCELTVLNPSVKLMHTKLSSFIHLHFHEKHWMNELKCLKVHCMYTERKKCLQLVTRKDDPC